MEWEIKQLKNCISPLYPLQSEPAKWFPTKVSDYRKEGSIRKWEDDVNIICGILDDKDLGGIITRISALVQACIYTQEGIATEELQGVAQLVALSLMEIVELEDLVNKDSATANWETRKQQLRETTVGAAILESLKILKESAESVSRQNRLEQLLMGDQLKEALKKAVDAFEKRLRAIEATIQKWVYRAICPLCPLCLVCVACELCCCSRRTKFTVSPRELAHLELCMRDAHAKLKLIVNEVLSDPQVTPEIDSHLWAGIATLCRVGGVFGGRQQNVTTFLQSGENSRYYHTTMKATSYEKPDAQLYEPRCIEGPLVGSFPLITGICGNFSYRIDKLTQRLARFLQKHYAPVCGHIHIGPARTEFNELIDSALNEFV